MKTDENGDTCLDDSSSQGISIEAGSYPDIRLDTEVNQEVRWSSQLKGVLKKNYRLYTHKMSSWAAIVVLPPILMIIVYFYTELLMTIEKPPEVYRDPITNYPTIPFPSFSSTTAAALCTQGGTPCMLGVSPDDAETRALATQIRDNLLDSSTGRMPPLLFYENSTALHKALNAEDSRFFGGVSFHRTNEDDFSNYTLYMKSSILPQDGYESVPSIYSSETSSLTNASMYISSGFATLQSAVDKSIMNKQLKEGSFNLTLHSKILPGWEANPIASTLGLFICFMALVSYSPLLTNGATLITNENVSKTRQYLFTLGLKRWVYWLSWVLTLFVPAFIISLLWIICCLASSTLSSGGAVYMVFYYALFSISIIMVIFIVQCLVKSVMWSTAISSAFLVLPPVIGSILPTTKWVQCVVSFFSSYTLYLATSNTTAQKLYGTSASTLNSVEILAYIIFDSILYGVIAWYLNEVFTGDYGVPKSPLFVFDKNYWRNLFGRSKDDTCETDYTENDSENGSKENFERTIKDKQSRNAGITLCNLTKAFNEGNIVAVNSVSGSFRRGEITCLLGQNGAGKTTLISSLYGLIKPSSGTAFVDGQNITTDIDIIRSSIGVCPQDDILYAELTAQDHIDLVMSLKGVPKENESGEYVKKLMDDLALFESADPKDPISAYSGGMKRKLSLIMSLIGNSRVIFLDEPTSGVDPVSKRSIWKVLSQAKEGRTVILTTHSMEEAESLSDYIYIMANGKFRCGGSPMFLKQKFGVGYYLSITKKLNCNVSLLHKTVEDFIPGAVIEKDVNDTISFRLPFSDVPKFSQLFEKLENSQGELGIDGFGLSLSTIEEVFVKICSESDSFVNPLPLSSSSSSSHNISHDINDDTNLFDTENDDSEDEENSLLEEQTTLEDKMISTWKSKEFKRASFLRQFFALSKFKLMFFKRNPSIIWSIVSVPLLNILFTLIILNFALSFIKGDTAKASFHNALEYAPTYVPYTWDSYEVTKDDVDLFVQRVNEVAPNRLYMKYVNGESEITKMALENRNINFALFFNKLYLKSGVADITIMYNQTRSNTPIDIVDLVYSGLRAAVTNTTGEISGLWVQQTLVSSSLMSGSLIEFVKGVISALILFTVYILVSMRVLETPIRDRECGIKAQLYISCLRPAAYVFSSLFVAIAALVPTYIISEFLFACFGIKVYTDASASFVLFFGTVLFVIGLTSMNHCYSNLFNNHTTASSWNFMVMYGIAFLPLIVYVILLFVQALIELNAFESFICDLVIFLFGLSPTYSFLILLVSLALQGSGYSISSRLLWDNSLSRSFMMLGLDAVVYLLISLAWEYKFDAIKTNVSQDVLGGESSTENNEDEDVLSEQRRVEAGMADMDNVVLEGLRKVYKPSTVAVRNLTLGIPENECFGLLGPNGSGKTTTINAMTAEIPITRGKVTVNGAPLCGRRSHFFARACISRCPQDGGLVDTMTVRDHLELMASLRADLTRSQVKALVKDVVSAIGLTKDVDKETKACSGGTLRKLCVAIAMMPGAAVTILDEPSTGMDVVSRRALWDFIQKGRLSPGKTFVLTTHSMEEAENVCTTIGIVSHGSLQCIGSPQRLKDKYSEGYIITLGVGPHTSVKDLERILLSNSGQGNPNFSGSSEESKLRVGYANDICRMYEIKNVSSLSRLFADLEAATHNYGLRSYTVSQTSLETVFLHVVKEHEFNN